MTTKDEPLRLVPVEETAQEPQTVQERLYATTDAMVWAEEFCRTFDGRTISLTDYEQVDPGTMVGWFANYWGVITQKFAHQPIHLGTWQAFLHFYYLDYSNAATHGGDVRFSPITFRLAEFLKSQSNPVTPHPESDYDDHLWDDDRLNRVIAHLGEYDEDRGR